MLRERTLVAFALLACLPAWLASTLFVTVQQTVGNPRQCARLGKKGKALQDKTKDPVCLSLVLLAARHNTETASTMFHGPA